MKNEIVYGSDPQPGDGLLRSLAILYDKIYLPHPYGLSEESRVLWQNWDMNFQDDRDYGYAYYSKWKDRNKYLFDEGIIETLPDVFDKEWVVGDNVGEELIRRFGIDHLDNYIFNKKELIEGNIRFGKSFILYGKLALALHYGYANKNLPHFIWAEDLRNESNWESLSKHGSKTDNDHFSTTNIRNQLMGQLLSSDSLIFNVTAPEKVLKLRDEYANEREALSYYIDEISNSVRQHLRDGALPDEAARRSLESEIFPKIAEFKRIQKLASKKRFINYFKGFMKIDAAPWSPKFFMQFAQAVIGLADNIATDQKEGMTNQMQSFRLLAKISEN